MGLSWVLNSCLAVTDHHAEIEIEREREQL